MTLNKDCFWIPVTVVSRGFVRVEANNAIEAQARVEDGSITDDNLVGLEIDSVTATGPPEIVDQG